MELINLLIISMTEDGYIYCIIGIILAYSSSCSIIILLLDDDYYYYNIINP